jgi:hypothetical protein
MTKFIKILRFLKILGAQKKEINNPLIFKEN